MLHVYEPAAIQIGRLRRYVIRPEDKLLTAAEYQTVLKEKFLKAGGLVLGDGNNNKSSGKVAKKAEKRSRQNPLEDGNSTDDEDDSEPGTDRSSGWTTEDKPEESHDGCVEEQAAQEGSGRRTRRAPAGHSPGAAG